jgi:hypothetical protein
MAAAVQHLVFGLRYHGSRDSLENSNLIEKMVSRRCEKSSTSPFFWRRCSFLINASDPQNGHFL